jgi:hypothetical protein
MHGLCDVETMSGRPRLFVWYASTAALVYCVDSVCVRAIFLVMSMTYHFQWSWSGMLIFTILTWLFGPRRVFRLYFLLIHAGPMTLESMQSLDLTTIVLPWTCASIVCASWCSYQPQSVRESLFLSLAIPHMYLSILHAAKK